MLTLNSVMIGTKQTKRWLRSMRASSANPPNMADAEHGFYGWQLGATYLSILDPF